MTMTPALWFVVCMATYQAPDFYINKVPFWVDKRRTHFNYCHEMSEEWMEECKKFDDENATFIVNAFIYEYDVDYD